MHFPPFPFSVTDFAGIEPEVHKGVTGYAEWRIVQKGDIRIRLVTYSAGYLADHWCAKGHLIFCHEGSMETELEDGSKHLLQKGQFYSVGDNAGQHRTFSKEGCVIFIVD